MGRPLAFSFNPIKTESLLFSRKSDKILHPPIFINTVRIETVQSHKRIGVLFSNYCSWHDNIQEVKKKACSSLTVNPLKSSTQHL